MLPKPGPCRLSLPMWLCFFPLRCFSGFVFDLRFHVLLLAHFVSFFCLSFFWGGEFRFVSDFSCYKNRFMCFFFRKTCLTNIFHFSPASFFLIVFVGNTNTNVRKLHVSTMTSQRATRDPTTQQQGWRCGLVSLWRLDRTRGSQQDIHSARMLGSPGRLWMAPYHHNEQETHCAL